MVLSALSGVLALSGLVVPAFASVPVITSHAPLASFSFQYPNLPEQVDPFPISRGPQAGFNICNSTTVGPDSFCQTAFLNNLADFCMWGPSSPNSLVQDTEAAMVAWCTNPNHGTRVIPRGAITGVQYIKTSVYVQVVGFLDQTAINIAADDDGGEEDPFGDDGDGNPIGALVFSNSLPSSTSNTTFVQARYWTNFLGDGVFCFKACDASKPNALALCQHTYDRIGCNYNSPASYDQINGTFTSCDGDLQDPAGIYVVNGVTSTYKQPGEGTAIDTLPYTPRVPNSSNCKTFQSTDLFTAAATRSTAPISTTASSTNTGGLHTTTKSGSSSSIPSQTSKPSAGDRRITIAGGLVSGVALVGVAAIML